MIPLRVRLRGFLSYKDEQEIDFSGGSVWLLAGLNGSGKSSVFDAVTYALFGHHRGGAHDAVELINKDSDRTLVEFEFSLDDHSYRITRTLQRTKQGSVRATQQIAQQNVAGLFEPVEGTTLQKGFKEWIELRIGLSYETFTSSVLLLQGRAEKLLDSTAKGRFEVLAGIVNLERYERLHRRADEERKHLDGRAKTTRERLRDLPEVGALEILEAAGKIEDADKKRSAAQAEWEHCQALEFQARQWQQLQEKLAGARTRVARTEKTLAEALAIETNLKRLRELEAVLPRVQDFVAARSQIHTAEQSLAEFAKQHDAAKKDLQQLDDQLKLTRQQRGSLLRNIEQDEKSLQQIAAEVRKLHAQVEKLNEVDRQEQQRQRLLADLKRLPADPREQVRQARERVQSLEELKQALGPLARLHEQRLQLGKDREQAKTAAAEAARIRQQGERLREEVDRLRPQLEDAAGARQRADQGATRDRTLVDQARGQLDEFLKTDGAKVCRLCGQALTAGHWQQEKERRATDLAALQQHARQSAAAAKEATAREKSLRDQLAQLETQLAAAREAYKVQHGQAEQHRRDVERLQRECASTYVELSQPFRGKVAETLPSDWPATGFPTETDLDLGRQQVSTLPAQRRALQEANDQLNDWNKLHGHVTALEQTLERLRGDLPRGGDGQALRQAHARQEAQEKALQATLAARRKEAEEAQKLLDRLGGERERLQQQLAQTQNHIARQQEVRKHGQQNLDRARKELPPTWQAQADTLGIADVHRLRSEQETLIAARTEERARQLHEARAGLDFQRQEVADLEAEEPRFPAEARCALADVQERGQDARMAYQARDRELAEARLRKHALDAQHLLREQSQVELLRLEQELNHAKLLADLLGRDRLQLHLVRQAERQVVDHANAVLDRLSGGQLYLRLAGQAGGDGEDSSTKALELEAHNRHTGERPINVAFLSGSQRFRVAVSLALGIGQYASRQHRPLESVIIDEGFGCLDRFGRQLMIQELQNLRGQMRCILLVSHQEDFAEAFSDGYKFELTNGSTVATRFSPR